MAFTPLSRYPDNPQDARKPDLEIWHTALVRAVNGVLGVNGTGGVWTVGNGSGAAGVTLDSTGTTLEQSSGLNLYSFSTTQSAMMTGAYFDGTNFIALATTAAIFSHLAGSTFIFADTGLTVGAAFTPTARYIFDPSTLTLAGGQVAFPAVQNPSSDAHTLDDYEEGAWTPIDSSGAGLVLVTKEGYYVKIGQFVMASAFITYPATVSGAAATIGGAPFTSRTTTNVTNAGTVGFTNSGLAVGVVLANNGTTMTFPVFATAANATNVQFTGVTVILSLVYRAAA